MSNHAGAVLVSGAVNGFENVSKVYGYGNISGAPTERRVETLQRNLSTNLLSLKVRRIKSFFNINLPG